MGAHLEYAKYIKIRIVMYFDVFCVFQWAPTTILPPLVIPPPATSGVRLHVVRAQSIILKKNPPFVWVSVFFFYFECFFFGTISGKRTTVTSAKGHCASFKVFFFSFFL